MNPEISALITELVYKEKGLKQMVNKLENADIRFELQKEIARTSNQIVALGELLASENRQNESTKLV